MKFLEINRETCTKCGACAEVCPSGLIDFEKKDFPRAVEDIEKHCIRCGHCVAVCPTGSVIHREMPLAECPPIKAFPGVSYEQCDRLIRGRRSVREYLDKPVPPELIEKLIDSARYAPTGGNSQEVHWMVFNGKDEMSRLTEIGDGWIRAAAKASPVTAARMEKLLEMKESGRDGFLRGAPALIAAYAPKTNPGGVANSAIALGYLELLANSLGLGGCWAGFFMFAAASFPPMIKAINLPEGQQVCGAMMLGFPKYRYARIPARKPAKITWK
jgi:nitroreductase/NAD-dependent dihydropyrimidine dehydrogenase PreA subunit